MRESYASLHVPSRGAEETPYASYRDIARGMGAHLAECFLGEIEMGGDAETGLAAERTADIAVPGTLIYASSDNADTTQTVTAYGVDGNGDPVSETVTLNGTTDVDGVVEFASVLAVVLDAVAAGTVTVTDTVPTTLVSISTGDLTAGYAAEDFDVNGVLYVSTDADIAGGELVVLGLDADGNVISEAFALDTAHATPLAGSLVFSRVTALLLGDIAGARTVTVAPSTSVLQVPYVPAIFDLYNTALSLSLRWLPGSSGPLLVDMASGALSNADVDLSGDGSSSGEVILGAAVAAPGTVISVACLGVRPAGSL